MAAQVIKRDGSKEAFDEQKIRGSIEKAARGAGLADDRIAALVGQVAGVALQLAAGKEEIATTEIRDAILAELDKVEPAASASWRKYDAEQGKV